MDFEVEKKAEILICAMYERMLAWAAEIGVPRWMVPNYWLMFTSAIIVGCLATLIIAHRRNEEAPVSDLLFFGILGLFIGSKLVYAWQYGHIWDHLFSPSGFSLYGGLIGLVAAWLTYYSVRPYPLLSFLDCAAPGMALGLFLGRIGCFIAGCNGGVTCELPWAVRFPPGTSSYVAQLREGLIFSDAPLSLPAHPTQLYESVFALIAFGLLLQVTRWKRWDGEVFLTGMIWYAAFRLPVEWIRADAGGIRPLGVLTFAQAISIVLLGVSLVVSGLLSRRQGRVSNRQSG